MQTVIGIALVVCIVISYVLIAFLVREGRMERRELEDRVMSIQAPAALMTHSGIRDREPANVTYIDEAREAELSPAGGWMEDS